MSDEIIECVKCRRDFIWTEGEQRFFEEHNLNRPKLCQECRTQRNSDRRPGMRDSKTPPFPTDQFRVAKPPPKSRKPPQKHRTHHMTQPVFLFGVPAVILALILTMVLAQAFSFNTLTVWFIAINGTAFLCYGCDKLLAKLGTLRIPESVLLAVEVIGGTLGAFAGMRIFRHKTAKPEFQRRFWIIAAIQLILVLGYVLLVKP